MQSYVDGDDAYVNIYGTPDGRTVSLDGPYFVENAPEGLQYEGRDLKYNEIAWVQTVTFPNGEQQENVIISRYNSIPRRVRNLYATVAQP